MTVRNLLLCAALALSAGCSSRYLVDVQDGPGGSTVLETIDTRSYVIFGIQKYVFWECREDGGGLACEKACDIRDDEGDKVLCPMTFGAGF